MEISQYRILVAEIIAMLAITGNRPRPPHESVVQNVALPMAGVSERRHYFGARRFAANVRFGSFADICAATIDVRFTPNSGRESGHLGPGGPPIGSRLSIARRDCQVSHIAAARLGGRWRVQREVVSGRETVSKRSRPDAFFTSVGK